MLEEIATKSGLGIVLDTSQEIAEYLKKDIFVNELKPNLDRLNQFGGKEASGEVKRNSELN